MADIKISDDELLDQVRRAAEEASWSEELLADMHNLISSIDNDSIKGDIRTNFSQFVSLVNAMQGQLSSLINEKRDIVTRFIADVDDADLTLY